MEKKDCRKEIFGQLKTREEALKEIRCNRSVYLVFLDLKKE
ncbi:hypothetical protein ABXS75_08985 [Roseburia hominis]